MQLWRSHQLRGLDSLGLKRNVPRGGCCIVDRTVSSSSVKVSLQLSVIHLRLRVSGSHARHLVSALAANCA